MTISIIQRVLHACLRFKTSCLPLDWTLFCDIMMRYWQHVSNYAAYMMQTMSNRSFSNRRNKGRSGWTPIL